MGSNSIRLVINAIYKNGLYKELHNFKVVARLSEHINEHGEITDEGMNIIIDTIRKFSEIITTHEVTETISVATAAIRNAINQEDIIHLIREKTGLHIRILSGYEEAYYGYLAIINSMNIKDGLSIDIGGGSTEITLFKDRKLQYYHSFPFGAVSLKKQFIKNDPPTKEEVDQLVQFLEKNFATLSWLKNQDLPVIGIGGTARNLTLVHQRTVDYPLPGIHQYEMNTKDVQTIVNLFCTLPLKKRQNIDGLSKDRADIIIPGALTISTFLNYVATNQFIMSKKGLRDGLFYEKLLSDKQFSVFPDVAKQSFYQIIRHYHINEQYIHHNFYLAKTLYEQICLIVRPNLRHEHHVRLLQYSSYVFYIGEAINSEAKSEHTFYLLTNTTIDGLSHKERLAIAFIASFKSKAKLNEYYRRFAKLISDEDLKQFELLGSILKMAYALDRTRRNVISDVTVTNLSEDLLVLHLFCQNNDPFFEIEFAQKQKKHLEKAINRRIELQVEHSSN